MSPDKFERSDSHRAYLRDMGRRALRDIVMGVFSVAVAVATHTVFPVLGWWLARRVARGERIWLDDIPSPPQHQSFDDVDGRAGDISPRPGRSQRARHMKAPYPSVDYPFAYRTPPVSGNAINGVGDPQPRRARHVFFGDGYGRAWGKLDWWLQVMEPTSIHRWIVGTFWQDRRRVGPVALRPRVPNDPVATAAQLEARAKAAGASLFGVTHLTDAMRFEDFDVPYRYAIAIGAPMDRETMLHTPSPTTGEEIMRSYRDINRIAIELAEYVRSLGYPARACTNLAPDSDEVLHLPVAIEAGLGQLGKHGSLLTAAHGSNVRLATVLTDLPLQIDEPVDLGVDDFCSSCRICETNCPPHAILPDKQMVRGVEKWSVDFDACIPYFAETGGCGICIQVCPWSEPGRGFSLAEKLQRRRAS